MVREIDKHDKDDGGAVYAAVAELNRLIGMCYVNGLRVELENLTEESTSGSKPVLIAHVFRPIPRPERKSK